jgi:hypothetical protein
MPSLVQKDYLYTKKRDLSPALLQSRYLMELPRCVESFAAAHERFSLTGRFRRSFRWYIGMLDCPTSDSARHAFWISRQNQAREEGYPWEDEDLSSPSGLADAQAQVSETERKWRGLSITSFAVL